MGYSHYWSHGPLPTRKWSDFEYDVGLIIGKAATRGLIMAEEYDRPGSPPIIDSDLIHFNGKSGEGYETFRLLRESENFNAIKTAERPYDKVVTAVLIAAKHHFGKTFDVRSDGTWADWSAGAKLYYDATGRKARNPLSTTR
jgi:hypothetical protein